MALVGTTYLNYGHNHWSALFNTPPANLVTEGVPLPDGSRFLVEFAKITPANVDNSPTVAWVDITAYVTSLTWFTGAPDGALSRWPIEQLTVITTDLTAVLGDFVEAPPLSAQTGPGPGSFIRWGIISPLQSGTWFPRMSCIVETIDDVTAGRVRGWRITGYGTLLYYAPLTYHRYTTSLSGNINTAIAAVLAEFVEASNTPWPWAENLAAQNANFPTDLSPAIVAGTEFAYLQFLHQCADSQGMRLFNDAKGGIVTEEWTTATTAPQRFTDETAVAVDGHSGFGLIGGHLKWKRSQDQAAGLVNMSGGGVVVDYLFTKWQRRHDAPGWPKTDLRSVPTAPQATAMCTAAAGLLVGSEVRLDQISVDTAERSPSGIVAWSLLTDLVPLWTRCRVQVERRRPGSPWIEVTALILGVGGVIDFTTGVGRARIDYYTRVVP
jgi:hypothetical protein